jgi:hypothetical protein
MLGLVSFHRGDGDTAGDPQRNAQTTVRAHIVIGHDRIHAAFGDHRRKMLGRQVRRAQNESAGNPLQLSTVVCSPWAPGTPTSTQINVQQDPRSATVSELGIPTGAGTGERL